MILEDHLKKCLSLTSGSKWQPYQNKNLPRNPHSAFGDFPPDYMKNANRAAATRGIDQMTQGLAEVSVAARGTAILKKGDGLGGKSVSLNKPKPKPLQQVPKAGAVNRRKVPPSEFRLFYDRGDLPVQVDHGSQIKI